MNPPEPPPLPDELAALCRRMRLPYMRGAAPDVLATARSQRWDPAEVLRVLLAEEVAGRDRATRAQRRRAAGLPAGKTFDTWADTKSTIPAPTLAALRTLEWVGRAENLAICGPSGTGKSHFCEAIAHQVIDVGMRVSWFTLESLTATVSRAKVDASINRVVTRIYRAELIVVDDIGMLPAGADAAEAFYRVVDAAYERRSVAVTSNLHPSGFDTIMPKTIATAAVDRLLHHAHLVATDGPSVRLEEALAGAGQAPQSRAAACRTIRTPTQGPVTPGPPSAPVSVLKSPMRSARSGVGKGFPAGLPCSPCESGFAQDLRRQRKRLANNGHHPPSVDAHSQTRTCW